MLPLTFACAALAAHGAFPVPPQHAGPPLLPLHSVTNRAHVGIPSLAVSKGGRLWATWYTGVTPGEDRNNYVVLSTSGDNGKTWKELLTVDPDGAGPHRAFDPELWIAPDGKLRWFWADREMPYNNVKTDALWAIVLDDPDSETSPWHPPVYVTPGVMMDKPIALSTGEWALPVCTWFSNQSSKLVVSADGGQTWSVRGGANIPKKDRTFDEHAFVERRDGSLWLLSRTTYGIAESVSTDRGATWPDMTPSAIAHPSARFFITRLASGHLLLVKHGPPQKKTGRSHLTAYVSEDDGKTWGGGLLLDERKDVSYPDGQQAADGTLYIAYDFDRTGARQILFATFREEDAAAGKPVSASVRLRQLVSQGSGGQEKQKTAGKPPAQNGERLYNGIVLPKTWPPRDIDPHDTRPMAVPYLDTPPDVIPIDVGRQLFVDDFLIETNTLARVFHLPRKYEGNPILKPETPLELHGDKNSAAVPKSGGVWWDPAERIFKMWYEAGWIGTICYATSRDGLHWERPSLDVKPGTNQVLPPDLTPDSWTVVPDWDAQDPSQRYKLFLRPPGGQMPGFSMTSPDGIHWTNRIATGETGDRSTMFYNPFRKKWVYSLRSGFRGRSRHYWECNDFLAGAAWPKNGPVAWAAADRNDPKDPATGRTPQLYNLDAVAYESLMLGFYEIHHGPENDVCEKQGLPKTTELTFAYSRDGFHWWRPDRRIAIPAERRDVWDRGYVQSLGNLCCVRGDTLWFYYSAFQGDASKTNRAWLKNGMYDRGATGLAFLRRDGFASMEAGGGEGSLTTRPVVFNGARLFVNAACSQGELRAEILDRSGRPIPPYTLDACQPLSSDGTLLSLAWNGAADLAALRGRPVRFRFVLKRGALYAFWVSRDATGRSDGYVAGGGPGFTGMKDTVGQAELDADRGADHFATETKRQP
jgi:hypothetical protein